MSPWEPIAETFEMLCTIARQEWGCLPPLADSLPDAALEQEVDVWCVVLAHDLMTEKQPPADVGPWALARLLSVAALARNLAESGDEDAPQLDAQTVMHLLITEWHGALKDRWRLMAPWLEG